ncbi:hypothetical protein WJX73_009759 [Symbiochloris irregularis]|uniref:Uncharacterized protein n=1 Tax=Symbiochloris irregularis TaxID=706552 RepID=A0AAW1NRH1_9CHLO
MRQFHGTISATQQSQQDLDKSLSALKTGLAEIERILPPAEWAKAASLLPNMQERMQKMEHSLSQTEERLQRIQRALSQRSK